jgi:hypothetical protein
MPIPKNKQKLYGKVIGFNLNRGKPYEEAKSIAEAAVKPGHQRRKKKG